MSDKNKNDISSSADNNKTSLLSGHVQAILQSGMTKGFNDPENGDGYLNLGFK